MLSYLLTILGEFKGTIQSAAIHNASARASHGGTAAKHLMEEHEKDPWLQDHEFNQVLRYFQEKRNERGSEFYNLFCSKGENMGRQWIRENVLKNNPNPNSV